MSDYIDALDPLQKDAVTFPAVPLKVQAGAGSGKTRVIISRIAHQIDEGIVAPHQVFASAFTKAAADEMGERIKELVPAEDLVIGTFHSIMYRFLNEWRTQQGERRLGVLKEYKKKRLIQELLDHPTKQYPDALNVEVDLREVMGRIGRWKNALVAWDDPLIEETIDDAPKDTGLGAAARVYALYERYKGEQYLIDFDDMLLMSYQLLESESEARAKAHAQWRAFFVDEAQDTNHAQWEIIKLIAPAADNPNITIVGDTRQCLYRFRGAIPELMDNFDKIYPTAQTVDLVLNYRSTRQVIKSANTLIKSFGMSDQEPVRGDGPEAVVAPFVDEADQGTQFALAITEAKERGYKGEDIAILVRTNAQTMDIERALVQHRHPYWCKGGGFFSHREIADILGYMRLAVDPMCETETPSGEKNTLRALRRVINKPTRYLGNAFVDAVERNLETAGGDILDAIQQTESYGTRRLSKNQRFEVERLVYQIRQLRDPDNNSRSMINFILEDRGIGYKTWLKKNEGLEGAEDDSREENIRTLLTAAWEYDKPADLVAFSDMTDSLQVESGDAVEIRTVHGAKGREWPIVLVSNFYEDSIPHKMAKREGSEPDERRIAYVSWTRAQALLVVGYPSSTAAYGQVSPSRYLADAEMEGPEDFVEVGWWQEAFDKLES